VATQKGDHDVEHAAHDVFHFRLSLMRVSWPLRGLDQRLGAACNGIEATLPKLATTDPDLLFRMTSGCGHGPIRWSCLKFTMP
jgi:hypothetical protein